MSRFALRLALFATSLAALACDEDLPAAHDAEGIALVPEASIESPSPTAAAPMNTASDAASQPSVSMAIVPDAGSSAPGTDKGKRMPCGVADSVTKYCAGCHVGEHVHGPVLASAADFRAKTNDGRSLFELARQKLNATDPHQTMPPAGYPKPSAAELGQLNAWLDQSAPDTDDHCPDALPPPRAESDDIEGLTCYPLLAHSGDLKSAYKVGVASDAYINFTFAPPWKQTEYGVLIRGVVEHAANVHHALLYEEVKPGTPGGPTASTQVHPDSLLIAAWLPGNPSMDLRKFKDDDVGLELRTDTTYTVELHYNSTDPNLTDRSGIEVCTRKQKPKNVASYAWVGMDNFLFASDKWVSTCRPTAKAPIRLLSVLPHMHLKGVHFKATLNRLDGSKQVIHDQPFDFRFERQYPVNLTLYPGESITTECTYSEPKAYGPNVEDEMCTLFTMHYPKGTLVDDGLWSVLHGGGACLGNLGP